MDFYPQGEVKELDLRRELNRFLFGSNEEEAHGQLFIIRKMRRLPGITYPLKETDLQRCRCSQGKTDEADMLIRCQWCDGERYYFDEEWEVGYKTNLFQAIDQEKHLPFSVQTNSFLFFYFESHVNLSRYDKLIEPLKDAEGNVINPVKYEKIHNIHMVEQMRSDNGRVEFSRAAVRSER